MRIVRSCTWVLAPFSNVQNLFSATELEGRNSGSQKIQLVGCYRRPYFGKDRYDVVELECW